MPKMREDQVKKRCHKCKKRQRTNRGYFEGFKNPLDYICLQCFMAPGFKMMFENMEKGG